MNLKIKLFKMKTVSFNVKLPSETIICILNKKTQCTITKLIETCSQCTGTADKTIIEQSISPNQLVYVIKEFNLLNRFRRRVYKFLFALNQPVVFNVVEPKNGNLIDHAW